MPIIGRKDEKFILEEALNSKQAEFVAVYGRRRVGKTFLIKEYLNEDFSFYISGVHDISNKDKLRIFSDSLKLYGHTLSRKLSDWFDAFNELIKLLESDRVKRNSIYDKRIIFIDELPWLDGAKSKFKAALDLFWNTYASSKKDIVLIVCGSATSWIINNLISDRGGFHNRITRKIHLLPFSLRESYELLKDNDVPINKEDALRYYMVFGGIPYYLKLISPNFSVDQNIDRLIFKENGQLKNEFNELFSSLFNKHDLHVTIVLTLGSKKIGMTRQELLQHKSILDGISLTRALQELEECGFIRYYTSFLTTKNNGLYQLVDSFVLFYMRFIKESKFDSWIPYINTPSYYSWCGQAFEQVAINHVNQIKSALGIEGIQSKQYSFKSRKSTPGAQIDLIIDRMDRIINLCEIKYSSIPYVITKKYREELLNKINVLSKESKTNSSIQLTMITSGGLKRNEYSDIVTSHIDLDDLFIK